MIDIKNHSFIHTVNSAEACVVLNKRFYIIIDAAKRNNNG